MSRRIFTLVELLVVIAIIAVLASLLLPTLANARATVKKVACSGNMRQVYLGMTMYSGDSNGWLPPTFYNANHIFYINDYLLCKYDSIEVRTMVFKNPKGVYFCPAITRASDSPCWTAGTPEAAFYISNYMPSISPSTDSRSGCWLNYAPDSYYTAITTASPGIRKLDNIKDGSVIMGDQAYAYVSGDFNQCAQASVNSANSLPTTSPLAPGLLHGKSSNFLFKDGHAKSYNYGEAAFDSDYIPAR